MDMETDISRTMKQELRINYIERGGSMRILLLIFLAVVLDSVRRVNYVKRGGVNLSRFELCVGLVGFIITFIVKTILQMRKGITIRDVLLTVLCFLVVVLVVGVYKSLVIVKCAGNTPSSINALNLSTYLLLILGIVGSIITLFVYFLL